MNTLEPDRAPSGGKPVKDAEQKMLELLRKFHTLQVAGITDCRAALFLVEQGLAEITHGDLTLEGGSGVIREKK